MNDAINNKMGITFGPVPSRRLGSSLGINNIPNKICSYDCVYCQLGVTSNMQVKRRGFYDPDEIFREAKNRVERIGMENIDYITFVPDGEPTLDSNLGKEVELLRKLDIPLAIITNSSLLGDVSNHGDIAKFDLVSVKVDAVSEDVWRKVNRPHNELVLSMILEGLMKFRANYDNKIITETMLVDTIDYSKEIPRISDFLGQLDPDEAYVAVPIRPPSAGWAIPPGEETVNFAYQTFAKKVRNVEYLIGYEGDQFSSAGNFEDELLGILSVHPMREDALQKFVLERGETMDTVKKMISMRKIIVAEFQGRKFYLRRMKGREVLRHPTDSGPE